jgi:Flp pilus assembly protein TadD
MPTVLEALKFPVPKEVQGKNLLPLLAAREIQKDEPRSLYSETFLPRLHCDWSELRGLEVDKYFIDAPKLELYDLSKDPKELDNLFAQKRGVAEELKAKLDTLIRAYTPGQELAEKTNLDPALMQRLKSLGNAGFSGGGSVKASYLLGLNYYRLKDFAKAVEEFQRVLQLSPDYSLATYQLGLSYGRAGDSTHAIETLKRASQLDPTNFAAAYNLGAVYLQQQMTAEAITAFRQCITIASQYVPGHLALGQVFMYEERVDEAIAELRQVTALAPQDPNAHAALANALEGNGLVAEAEQKKRKARELAEGDSHP